MRVDAGNVRNTKDTLKQCVEQSKIRSLNRVGTFVKKRCERTETFAHDFGDNLGKKRKDIC